MSLVLRKGTFATGGPSRVRPAVVVISTRPVSGDTTLYIGLEDGVEWLGTEDTSDPLVLE
jgi:hypothetical protein